MEPLFALTKKNVPYYWDNTQQNTFKTLKELITLPPVLQIPCAGEPLTIKTNASGNSIGRVLLAKCGGKLLSVSFFSQSLLPY